MKSRPADLKKNNYTRRHILRNVLVSAASMSTISGFIPVASSATASHSVTDNAVVQQQTPGIILDYATTSWANIRNDRQQNEVPTDNFADLQQLLHDKKYITIDTPVSISDSIILSVKKQVIEGGSGGLITPLKGMENKFLLQMTADATKIRNLNVDNPLLLKSPTGGRQGGIAIAAHYCEIENCYFWRMLQSVVATSSFGAYGTKVINNWFLECLGAGGGSTDPDSHSGEDRGDAVTIWGAGSIISGNHAMCRADQDARIAFHAEGLYDARRTVRDIDHKDIIMTNNMARGPFRRHFVMENITNGISTGNISMGGATWWGEAYIQCKNIIAKNVIYYDTPSGNHNGSVWQPVKAAIASVNFNSNVNISSNVLLSKGTRACGFATSTQTGETDVTLSGFMRNEGHASNTAVFLNNPSNFRLENLRSDGFAQALDLRVTRDTCINSVNCQHTLNNSNNAVVITSGRGGSVNINGDIYRGSKTAFVLPNISKLSIQNTTIEASERFATLSGIMQSLIICNNQVSGDKKLSLHFNTTNAAPDITWRVEGNTGMISQLHYTLDQLKNRQSKLNQFSKFAGKNIPSGHNTVWIALGEADNSPWLNLVTHEILTPV
ncbi:hypothetical protein ACGVWS_04945 [Enterobacteriaceae bacterium LUAb1]